LPSLPGGHGLIVVLYIDCSLRSLGQKKTAGVFMYPPR